jgi:hypothetical protein
MWIGMIGYRRDSLMTNRTPRSLRPLMTILTMLLPPSATMRIRMIRNRGATFMANSALLSFRRSNMAAVTMLITPPGQVWIGMRADIGLMANNTPGSCALARMTTEAVTPIPARLV